MIKFTLIAIVLLCTITSYTDARFTSSELRATYFYNAYEASLRLDPNISNSKTNCIMEIVRSFSSGQNYKDVSDVGKVADGMCSFYEKFGQFGLFLVALFIVIAVCYCMSKCI